MMPGPGGLWLFFVAALLLPLAASSASSEQLHDERFKCDVPREERAAITFKALELLQREQFEIVSKGVFAGHPPKDGEQVAGNPNTLYLLAGFNDTEHKLVPADYPIEPWDPADKPNPGPKPPAGPLADQLMGVTFQRHEAIVFLFCTPPPAKYFGLTSYVTNRLLPNMTEFGTGYTDTCIHRPVAEIKNPFNPLVMNTTKGAADDQRETDRGDFFESLTLAVFSPSREVYHTIRNAYIAAGLAPHATNFYPISAQTIRLHDRSKPVDWDFPDRVTVLCRVSYFDDHALGDAWAGHPWPAFFFRAPDIPHYQRSLPEPRLLSDVSGETERVYLPTMERLMDAIVDNKTKQGHATLVRKQQIVAVPNDRGTRDQCLNNASFVSAVDPIMTGRGGCGFGTTDCRYGTSAALDQYFDRDLFFVVVGVQHEALRHSSYSSVMLTSALGYEERNHTLTIREHDGAGAPSLYLSAEDNPDINHLYSVTFARQCPVEDTYCHPFTESQFAPDDIIYWMERAYLQRSTGVAPNVEEYVQSFVLTFRGSLV